MVKRGALLLLVMLISIPGCGGRKGKSEPKKTRKMAHSDAFSRVNMPLASDEIELADDTVRSYFDKDMQEFVTFTEEGDDFDLYGFQDDADMRTVYFDFDKYAVRPDQKTAVEADVTYVKRALKDAREQGLNPKVVVSGHACTSAGSKAYNLALSERRAKEVANQLVAHGVDSKNIKPVGRGSEMLVRPDGDREEQWVNRRVELNIVYS